MRGFDYTICDMTLEITTHEEHKSGIVYEFNGNAVYAPASATERVNINLEDDHDAVRAVGSVHRETPPLSGFGYATTLQSPPDWGAGGEH